jgi:hypothetical protein
VLHGATITAAARPPAGWVGLLIGDPPPLGQAASRQPKFFPNFAAAPGASGPIP